MDSFKLNILSFLGPYSLTFLSLNLTQPEYQNGRRAQKYTPGVNESCCVAA